MANTEQGLAAVTASMQAAKKEAHDDAVAIEEKLAILTNTAARGPSPAEQKQTDEDTTNTGNKTNTILKKMSAGITGQWELGKKSAKVALKGIGAALLGVALGAALYGIGEFLQSETFKKLLKYLKEEVVPALESFWNNLKDSWEVITDGFAVLLVAMGIITAAILIAKFVDIAKKVAKAFKAVRVFMLKTMLPKVQDMIGGVVAKFASWAGKIKTAFTAVQVFMIDTMLPKVKAMVGGVVAKFASWAGKIAAAFTAVTTFMSATMLPAVTAFMVPLLPIIAIVAAVSLVLYALWNAFEDFQTTLDETGSIGEALKVGIAKFMGTILGFIPALILKLVGWVAGLFGFDDFKEKVVAIDPIQWISDTIKGLFDKLFAWFGLLFKDPVKAMKDLVKGFFEGYLDIASWIVDMIKKPIVWLLGLFGWDDAAAAVETFSLKGWVMEMWGKVKTWFTGLFSWAAEEEKGDSWLVITIKKVITGVKEWFGNMFDFDTLKSSLASLINIVTWLPNLVMKAVTSVTTWLLGLFGFDEAAEKVANASNWTIGGLIMGVVDSVIVWITKLFSWGKKAGTTKDGEFSLAKLIGESIQKIWDWFKGLLDIDVMSIAKKIPGAATLLGWMSDKSLNEEDKAEIKKHGQTLKGATESGLYDQDIVGDSEINKKALEEGVKSGLVQKEMLDAILADKDLSDEDTAFMKKLVEQATKKGSLFTRDQGLHDRLDRIFPPEAAAIAGYEKDRLTRAATASAGGGGGSVTSMINAPTTSNITTTGNSGQVSLQNNKYGPNNKAALYAGYG